MFFVQPEFITIPRTEAFIALVAFAGYLFFNNMGNRIVDNLDQFKTDLLTEISDIKDNLPVKSNPGAYQPVKIPSKRKAPRPTGGSALAGLVIGGAIGALISGGTGVVVGALVGSIFFDQIEQGRRRRPKP